MPADPDGDAPRRLRRAEAVLASRMARLAVVVEDLHDPHNIDAVVRSAEAFGVQHLYRVENPDVGGVHPRVTQGAHQWLTLHAFTDPAACLDALHEDGYEVWAADVSPGAVPLGEVPLPARLAVAVGSELEGLSPALRDGAEGRFYLPMAGFTGSLNVSVTAAILIWEMVRRMVERDGVAGDLDAAERDELRRCWYHRLARTEAQKRLFPSFLDAPPPPLFEHTPPPERRSLQASRKDRNS